MEVYKDECTFSFDNQESPTGIDVCLTCYIGTSPSPGHDFTARHSRITGHTAFLNLHKVPKPPQQDPQDQQEHQPKKLAIARETEETKFDTIATFKTLAADSETAFQNAIDFVLKADSYSKAKETEAWELELQPCEHVAIHESVFANAAPQPLSSEQLSHCAICELDKNLWLCLECGALGCGRRQFDGSGGNGHALNHFEETQHALAVKLGSITPEGHVDVFCYADNDDVSDPQIKDHLAHWGIDIAKLSKTEKSMTELQLEQNMSWDFAGVEDAERVSGKGLTGLTNLGNSCYLNSVVQNLFAIPAFSDLFEPNDPTSNDEGSPNDLTTQLRKMKDGLESGRYDHVSPVMLKYLIGKSHPEFATMRQQDAFEFLTHLLTVISKNVKGDPTMKLFGFETERRIACSSCDAVRYITEKQENISIAVPIEEVAEGEFKPVSMMTLLDLFTAEETIESLCPKCRAPTAVSKIGLKSFPQILAINARRFRILNWVPQKVDVPVIAPKEINLDKYLSTGPQANENVIENTEPVEPEFVPNPELVAMLSSMGFPDDLSVNALRIVDNRGQPNDLEAATEVILSGEAAESAAASTQVPQNGGAVDPESLVMLESMGFPAEQAVAALGANNGNMEQAVDWLFSGKYEEYVTATERAEPGKVDSTGPAEQPVGDSSLPANYELRGTVLHKGASVHVGHYIAAVNRGDEFYVFNDEKVSKGADVDSLQQLAYIYLFSRVSK